MEIKRTFSGVEESFGKDNLFGFAKGAQMPSMSNNTAISVNKFMQIQTKMLMQMDNNGYSVNTVTNG